MKYKTIPVEVNAWEVSELLKTQKVYLPNEIKHGLNTNMIRMINGGIMVYSRYGWIFGGKEAMLVEGIVGDLTLMPKSDFGVYFKYLGD